MSFAVIAGVIGAVAAAVAILEAIWGIMPRKVRSRQQFARYFKTWEESGGTSLPSHNEYRAVYGVVLKNKLSPEEQTFALMTALQHGDPSMHELVKQSQRNDHAIRAVVAALAGRGIRVGWRAEFLLTRFARDLVEPYLLPLILGNKSPKPVQEAATRVLEAHVIVYLEEQLQSAETKYRDYAREVLVQIGARA